MIYKVLALILLLMAVGGWGWMSYQEALHKPVVPSDKVAIEIKKGDSFAAVTENLRSNGITVNPIWFRIIALQKKAVAKIKVGHYELKGGLTTPQLLTALVSGKAKQYAITFPEGWSFKEILQQIAKNPHLQHTLEGKDHQAIMAQLGAANLYPEGLFFPDTYFFEKNATDFSLLKRAYHRMQRILADEWDKREDSLPLKSSYEALILASIVEKETGAKSERPQIAGVFTRRLQKGMLLQTDPTVIYGMGDKYNGNITVKDLTTPTAYNTYTIKGLPPTPIALPGKDAINATLHPTPGDSLYFVARGDGSGTHVFSATLAEHNAAVNIHQRKKN
jgi:UPF0755 protein